MAFDFPNVPFVGQVYTDATSGASYEWSGYSWLTAGTGAPVPPAGGYVLKAGDTMTGPLILSEHPTAASPALQATTKEYVDNALAALGGNVGEAMAKNPANTPAWGAPIDALNY